MERFVNWIAPTTRVDFAFKVAIALLSCGALNHLRHVLMNGDLRYKTFWDNFWDASFTALPMAVASFALISHLHKLQGRMYVQAMTDQLTQIPNRRWFMDHCGSDLLLDQTLVLLDVDHFKAVNDTHGHDRGDICLVALAKHITNCLPPSAHCARLGGEEFGILFDGTTMQDCETCVAQICAGTDIVLGECGIVRITMSGGIFRAPRTLPVSMAFGLADRALYQSKAAGRARFTFAAATPPSNRSKPDQMRSTALA